MSSMCAKYFDARVLLRSHLSSICSYENTNETYEFFKVSCRDEISCTQRDGERERERKRKKTGFSYTGLTHKLLLESLSHYLCNVL